MPNSDTVYAGAQIRLQSLRTYLVALAILVIASVAIYIVTIETARHRALTRFVGWHRSTVTGIFPHLRFRRSIPEAVGKHLPDGWAATWFVSAEALELDMSDATTAADQLAAVQQFPETKSLDVFAIDFDAGTFDQLDRLTNLESITIKASKIHGTFATLGKFSRLRTLKIQTRIFDLENTSGIDELSALTEFELHSVETDQLGQFEKICRLRHLQSLSIEVGKSFRGDLALLADLTDLRYLRLSLPHAQLLKGLPKIPQLATLDLTIDNAIGLNLAPVVQLLNLKVLQISTSDDLAASLEELKQLPELADLHLQSASISVKCLQTLQNFRPLRGLWVECSEFNERYHRRQFGPGIRPLVQALRDRPDFRDVDDFFTSPVAQDIERSLGARR